MRGRQTADLDRNKLLRLNLEPQRRVSMQEQGISNSSYGAEKFGLGGARAVHWNLIEPELYEFALARGEAELTAGGALCAETDTHTGRSPKDKYIVCDDQTKDSVWWDNNGKITPEQFQGLLTEFIAHCAGKTLYAQDLLAGADDRYGLRTRVFTEKAWHSLFIWTLLIRPARDRLEAFVPELTILSCPSFRADPQR